MILATMTIKRRPCKVKSMTSLQTGCVLTS